MVNREQVNSADGTVITYEVTGTGPGLVIVPGGLRTAQHYRKLAGHLVDSHTVYSINRRGRAGSGPQGDDYRIDRECEDVIAVLAKTRSDVLFGHSYGGLIALEVAMRYPLAKLVLYEPAMSVRGSFPDAWLPAFRHALARGRGAEAMAIQTKGTRMAGPLNALPTPLLALLIRGWMRSHPEMAELQPTYPAEFAEVKRLDSTIDKYKDVTAQTLLLIGGRGPAYLRDPSHLLASIITRSRLVSMPKLDHLAPDEKAPERVADELKRFITDPETP
jgi:pimeloyl-ACP methyl ester carboxylesterase